MSDPVEFPELVHLSDRVHAAASIRTLMDDDGDLQLTNESIRAAWDKLPEEKRRVVVTEFFIYKLER